MDTHQEHQEEGLLNGQELPREAWLTPEIPAGLRESLLARTTAGVRSRTRRRRAVFLGGVAAAYAAGLVTAFALAGGAPEEPPAVVVSAVDTHKPTEPVQEESPEAFTPTLLNDPEGFALLLVRSPVEKQAELLKAAGDTYLNDYGEVQMALNCYRRLLALQVAGDSGAADPTDSWLLRSMKQARLLDANMKQEDTHEQETL